MPKPERRTRICWTEVEMEQVAEAAFLHYLEGDPMSIWELIAEGQTCLPKNRQRSITGKASVHIDVIAKFHQIRKDYFRDLNSLSNIVIETERVETIGLSTEEMLDRLKTEELMEELIKRMTPLLVSLPHIVERFISSEFIKEKVEEMSHAKVAKTVSAVPEKPKLPKILLLEFLPNQETIIKRKVEDLGYQVELIFGGKDRREDMPTCNWCILNKKVSHSLSDKLNKQVGKKRVSVVTGIDYTIKRIKEIAEAGV